LQAVAPTLIGERDFKAFGHDPMKRDNTVREVYVSEWSSMPIANGVLLRYTVEANAFLYHMVRRMVAVQIAVGRGKMSINELMQIVADGAIEKVRQIAPPHGLVLEKVRYSDDNN
jgi:tRNA pseudouridine38-40 synthase